MELMSIEYIGHNYVKDGQASDHYGIRREKEINEKWRKRSWCAE